MYGSARKQRKAAKCLLEVLNIRVCHFFNEKSTEHLCRIRFLAARTLATARRCHSCGIYIPMVEIIEKKAQRHFENPGLFDRRAVVVTKNALGATET